MYLEYISGDTLQHEAYRFHTVCQKLSIAKQIIDTVSTIHNSGIIHRDINPANIMMTDDQITIIDFGICKILGETSKETTNRMATNRYAAPEVAYHCGNASPKSDMYSVGATILFLFTKQEPPLPQEINRTISLVGGIDPLLKDVLIKMTETNPDERYEDMAAVDIAMPEIVYSPERAGLYIHRENKNFLIVYKDVQKEIYSAATHQQMQQKTPEIKWLYDYDKSNMRNWDRPCWNRKNENIALAKMTDCYRLMEKNEASLAEFDAAYFCDRTLLSGEVEDLLSAINYFKPKRIAIISSHILKYLTNNVIRQELIDSLNKTEVIICYPKVDLKYQSQKINDEIAYIKRSVANGSCEQIKFFELEDYCDRTVIICDPGFVIGITYNYIADSEGDMYLQEYGAVYFSPATVTHISSLIEEYVQQHLVVEVSGKR